MSDLFGEEQRTLPPPLRKRDPTPTSDATMAERARCIEICRSVARMSRNALNGATTDEGRHYFAYGRDTAELCAELIVAEGR